MVHCVACMTHLLMVDLRWAAEVEYTWQKLDGSSRFDSVGSGASLLGTEEIEPAAGLGMS